MKPPKLILTVIILLFSVSISFAGISSYEKHIAKGIAAIEADRYSEAVDEFNAALKEKPGDYTAILYTGITLSRSGDKNAVLSLNKALSMKPNDPRINLELGIYYFNKSMNDEASDYFENTIKLAPNTEFSRKAEEYRKFLKHGGTEKPWALGISTGLQYDTNVVLNPDNVPLPSGISNKSDWRLVFYFNGKYNIIKSVQADGFIGYSLYQSFHSRLSDFNITEHKIELSAGYRITPVVKLKGAYSFDYLFAGGEDYDYAHSLSPSIVISENNGFETTIEYRYKYSHFMNSDLFQGNSDRTGSNNLVGITQNIPINTLLSSQVGYSHDWDSTREELWDYTGNKCFAVLKLNLSNNVLINLNGEYYHKNYDGADLSGNKRKDRVYTAAISATETLSQMYSITIGQLYTRSKSNIDAYEYERAITSLFLNVRF